MKKDDSEACVLCYLFGLSMIPLGFSIFFFRFFFLRHEVALSSSTPHLLVYRKRMISCSRRAYRDMFIIIIII